MVWDSPGRRQKKSRTIHGGDRTRNLPIRSRTRYPLRHMDTPCGTLFNSHVMNACADLLTFEVFRAQIFWSGDSCGDFVLFVVDEAVGSGRAIARGPGGRAIARGPGGRAAHDATVLGHATPACLVRAVVWAVDTEEPWVCRRGTRGAGAPAAALPRRRSPARPRARGWPR